MKIPTLKELKKELERRENKITPNWEDRNIKAMVRSIICHEIFQLPNPTDLTSLHLPGENLMCIRTFHEKGAPISHYYGVEKNAEICQGLKKTRKSLPPTLQRKITIEQGNLAHLFLPGEDNKLREKMKLASGVDIIYLDLMCSFRECSKAIIALLCLNKNITQRAFDKGNPCLLYFTFSLRGNTNTIEDKELLKKYAKENPHYHEGKTSAENYRQFICGLTGYLNARLHDEGIDAINTHAIIYGDDALMVSVGFQLFKRGINHPFSKQKPIEPVFLGIENFRADPHSVKTLRKWQQIGVIPNPRNDAIGEIASHFKILHQQIGRTPKQIAEDYCQEGFFITEQEVRQALKPAKKKKGNPTPPKATFPKPSELAAQTLRILAQKAMDSGKLETHLAKHFGVTKSELQQKSGPQYTFRNRVAHVKRALTIGRYLQTHNDTHSLTKAGVRLANRRKTTFEISAIRKGNA